MPFYVEMSDVERALLGELLHELAEGRTVSLSGPEVQTVRDLRERVRLPYSADRSSRELPERFAPEDMDTNDGLGG